MTTTSSRTFGPWGLSYSGKPILSGLLARLAVSGNSSPPSALQGSEDMGEAKARKEAAEKAALLTRIETVVNRLAEVAEDLEEIEFDLNIPGGIRQMVSRSIKRIDEGRRLIDELSGKQLTLEQAEPYLATIAALTDQLSNPVWEAGGKYPDKDGNIIVGVKVADLNRMENFARAISKSTSKYVPPHAFVALVDKLTNPAKENANG